MEKMALTKRQEKLKVTEWKIFFKREQDGKLENRFEMSVSQ